MTKPASNIADPDAFLPLRPVEFEVLLSLGRGPSHGYRVLLDTEERSGARLELGTLYRALRRMESQGLIERLREAPADDDGDDPRRRYYELTRLGRAVAAAETRRMEGLVRVARDLRIAGAPADGEEP